ALLAEHPTRIEGDELRQWFDQRGVQFGPAFTGLTAARIPEGTVTSVLAEVGLPGQIRSQQAPYGIHPALLDACFQSVAAHPDVQGAGSGLLLPLGVRRLQAFGPTRGARYCYARVTDADGSKAEADLDVLDEHGNVLLRVQGLLMGGAAADGDDRDRVLGERLLTIEWQRRDLPEADSAAGKWLLVSTSATADVSATRLSDALKQAGAESTSMCWPQQADHADNVDRFRAGIADGVTGVVVLTGPKNGNPDDAAARRGSDYVRHLVRITRELAEIDGDAPRLFVVTRGAQA